MIIKCYSCGGYNYRHDSNCPRQKKFDEINNSIARKFVVEKKQRIANFDTVVDAIDRLIIEVGKCHYLEDMKAKEHDKPEAERNYEQLAFWDALSRRAVNLRSALKNFIHEELERIVREGSYTTLREVKDFNLPRRSFVDALEDRCHDIGNVFLREEMAQQLCLDAHEAYEKFGRK